ncbi:MAG: CPBP family intramembrane metalloprotease, partial [Deltaproteobacteria bacterium]|nr:CPBP family intramembrane metalloprotease [Deltaproteobacteria bacterium]
RGGFDPRSAVALLLAAFHTFATELFFRAYCIRTLSKKLNGFWLPIFISALLYGLFYLSVWTIWQQPGFMKVPFVMLFTGLGIVFGFCYRKSGSFLVPWIMHFFGVLQYKLLF